MSNFDPSAPDAFSTFVDGTTTVGAEWLNAALLHYGNLADPVDANDPGDLFVLDRNEAVPGLTEQATTLVEAAGHQVDAIVCNGKQLVVAGYDGATSGSTFLEVLDPDTLAPIESLTPVAFGVTGTDIRLAIHGNWLVACFGSNVALYNLDSGIPTRAWELDHQAVVRGIDADENRVYIAGGRGFDNYHIRVLDRAGATLDWGLDLGVGTGAQDFIATFGDVVCFGGNDDGTHNLHVYTTAGVFSKSVLASRPPVHGFSDGHRLYIVTSGETMVLDPNNLTVHSLIRAFGNPPNDAVHGDGSRILGYAGSSIAVAMFDVRDASRSWVKILADDLHAAYTDGDRAWIGTAENGSGWNLARVATVREPELFRRLDTETDTLVRAAGRYCGMAKPPQVPAGRAHAHLYGTGGTLGLTASTPAKVTTFDTSGAELGVNPSATTDDLTIFQGGVYRLAYTMTPTLSTTGGTLELWLERNGTEIPGSRNSVDIQGSNEEHFLAGEALAEGQEGDVITLYTSYTGNATLTVEHVSMIANRVSA